MQTGDFAPLVFPSLAVARRRLRKLHDAGYVAAFIEQLHLDTRWVLDTKGYEALAGRDPDAPVRRAPRQLAPLKEHTAMLVTFWSRLVHSCHASTATSLQKFLFEWELADGQSATHRGPYRPDAISVLETGGKTNVILIEADTGTENPSYVAKHKVEVFSRLRRTQTSIHGLVPDRLLVLVPSQRRLRSIARATRTLDTSGVHGRVLDNDDSALDLTTGWQVLSSLDTS